VFKSWNQQLWRDLHMLAAMVPTAPAVYVRWSTEEQGSGTTLEEQRQTCLGFLAERGWPIRQDLIFIDEGFSAGSLERPAMTKLRKAVHAGKVDAVVVYKLDRLTRNIVDAVELVLKEWEGRCALVSVTQSSIDTTNPLGRQFFTLMASFAEFEREMIKDRTLSGKKRRAMQGRNPGFRPPYGYKIGETPGSIVVDDERAPTVLRMFELFASGVSMIEIARRFNAEAVPKPGDSLAWQDRTIRYMLQNPLYMGRLEYGKSSKNSPQKRSVVGKLKTFHKAPKHALVEEAVTPIVPLELWEVVQKLLGVRSRKTGFPCRAASSQYLLTGILKCRCGYSMAGVQANGHSYYRCRSGPGACTSTLIKTDVLDQAVLEAVRHQLQDKLGMSVLEAAAGRAGAARASLEATVANLKGALADIARKKEKARKDYFAGDLTGKLYSEFVAELDEQEATARASLQDAEFALEHPEKSAPDAAWMLEHLDKLMSDTWDQLDMGQKKHTLRLLVPRVTAYREKGTSFVHLDVTVATPDEAPKGAVTYTKEHFARGRGEVALTEDITE
jgi:site-specific DNA recombinase